MITQTATPVQYLASLTERQLIERMERALKVMSEPRIPATLFGQMVETVREIRAEIGSRRPDPEPVAPVTAVVFAALREETNRNSIPAKYRGVCTLSGWDIKPGDAITLYRRDWVRVDALVAEYARQYGVELAVAA